MTTANIRVGWYNDWDDATLSVDVSTVTGFEAANTQNAIRSSVLRSASLSTMTVTAVFPSSRTGSWLHIPKHALKGASVQLKLYTDNATTTLALNAGTISIPCYTASETFHDSQGRNDPFAADADAWLYFAETAYQSVQLIVSGTPSDVSYFEIGRVRLMRYMEMAVNPDYGLTLGLQTIEDRVRTQGGSLRGNMSAVIRTMQFDLNNLEETEYATWLDGYRLAGTTGEVSISVFPGDGTRTEAMHTMAGTFSAINSVGRQVQRLQTKVQFEES